MNSLSGQLNVPSTCNPGSGHVVKIHELTSLHLEMLDHLSKNESVRVKSQQRDEQDLCSQEKLEALRQILESNPALFLARFGQYILINHLKGFESIRRGNYDINFHLLELEHSLGTGIRKTRAKNRRFEALQRLVDTTDYFSEEEMQRRNPILYEQLVGRYHTKTERAAFLQQCSTSTSGAHATPLVDMLMAHMDRNDGSEGAISQRRKAQEDQIEAEDYEQQAYDDESESRDGSEGSDSEMYSNKRRKSNHLNISDEELEEIEQEERELFKEEFFTTMYRSFLEGKDKDFDYSTVDDNAEYDCGEILEQDSEDKYFDSEEAENVDLADDIGSALELEDKFRYPTNRTEDPVTKLQAEDDDEEDPLDRFMMGINDELKNK